MFTITGHSSYVSCFAFSADGKRVVTGSFDNLVKIWDARTGAEVCTLTGHLDQVTCIALSRDGKRVVSGSCDGLVKVWDAATGAEVRCFCRSAVIGSSSSHPHSGLRRSLE
ncbi:WD40-repeat-containing domain protein [Baffinella frigidus]|nr:WD40-repeat-containing domain protein [Cryptophyta sp. CCMP2293]